VTNKVVVNHDKGNERVAHKGSWEDCWCYICENYTPHEAEELNIAIEDDEQD
jgi:hypothetical protein